MFESQQRLFDIAIQKEVLPKEDSNRLKAYQELVYHRFEEVISNCLPLSVEHLAIKLERLIKEFMQQNPQTLYIWQVPNEFRLFLNSHQDLKEFPFLDDLLWYEWIEVELFMGEYKSTKVQSFSWENEYKLNSNTRIKELNYKVFEGNIEDSGNFWTLAYYDLDSSDVLFRELNEVLYMYLFLQEEKGSKKALKEIAKLAEADKEDVKMVLHEALSTLCEIGVIK